ncbi:U5 small nuclear ribonucleoprotein TSSC4 [Hetaerina americana]|uniref:U5 small nuclear ribonucleoprotein TSSC4 n=1 Tax=Hetaerina americana TaxID=62018 RepID=UPI003A7F58F3
MHDYEAPTFFVKGGGSAFSNRQKDIFGQLVDAEKETTEKQRDNKVVYMKNDDEHPVMDIDISKPPRRQCKKFRGKESIFKVPDVPPLFKPTAIPDFKRNPHKWVRYDLGDVSQDDMSEQANRSAAMSFFHELDERKKRQNEDDDNFGECPKPITFRDPKKSSSILLEKEKLITKVDEEEGKPHFRSSKLIMPEYIVGEKKPKKKMKREVKAGSSDETKKSQSGTVKLGHLVDDDEVE